MLKSGSDPLNSSLWVRLPLFPPFIPGDTSDVGEQRSGRNLPWLTSLRSVPVGN